MERAAQGTLAVEGRLMTSPKSRHSTDLLRNQRNKTAQSCISASAPSAKVLDLGDFLSFNFPPKEYILSPIIPTQGLVMLYAPRGMGKTMLALHIAFAVATGQPVCHWTAPKSRRVLYVDGEMPAVVMQQRLAAIVRSYPIAPARGFFNIVTPDLQNQFLNLATAEGQAAIEPHLSKVAMVVIDNLSTLCRAGRENETESWHPVQDWILHLRRRGLSMLLIHHSNKNGGQRGTSAREDVLDTVVALRRPSDYRMEQGARFEVRLEKARGLIGEDTKPFEAMLSMDRLGVPVWKCRGIRPPNAEMVRRLKDSGKTIRQIADETGLSKSKVGRLLNPNEIVAT
jgi:putative DNA primase/helicase